MPLPKPFSWSRDDARNGKFDGRFLIGVLTTGIYCLPSCAARAPKPENVQLFKTEIEAQAAALRACKRCRPDLFYRGESEDLGLFDGLAARVAADPAAFADAASLARGAGVSATKLADLFRFHAHLTPAAWLRRRRVAHAARELLRTKEKIAEIGFGVGFESESVFHRQFLAHMRMTPGAYRALDSASVFLLHLPAHYRAAEILRYHARDPESLTEKSEGNRLWKSFLTPDGPAILEIEFAREGAWARLHAARLLGRDSMATIHAGAIRMLGLNHDAAGFEARHAAFVAARRGLRLPQLPTSFDGLCWGIIGQQIHIKFAAALRREIVTLAGGDAGGGMRTHPTPERVAALSLPVLNARRFSRAKAEYLVGAAAAVATGELDIEGIGGGSAAAAQEALTARRGIGLWTARYVMLRAGFADAAPIGDSALATALQRLHALPERPDPEHAGRLMAAFAPFRSLATMHLWTSLREVA